MVLHLDNWLIDDVIMKRIDWLIDDNDNDDDDGGGVADGDVAVAVIYGWW